MTFEEHMKAIQSGELTKRNVISLRKAINADERRRAGYSVSSTAPKQLSESQWEKIMDALARVKPKVVGELHESGMKLLKSKRYKRQLESVSEIIEELESFHLVGFDILGEGYAVPVYRAKGASGKSFPYSCRSWQSGGNGPQIESGNYW